MQSEKVLLIMMVLVAASGCSRKEGDQRHAVATDNIPSATASAQKEYSIPREIRATQFTDKANWLNGINRQRRSQFLLSIAKEDPTPFLPGYRLRFAKSGTAAIVQVYRLENPGNSGIFITVDKDLDPLGDGHPHAILVEALTLQACRFSKDALWRNGVSLTQPGTFLLMAEKRTHIPFKAGDRLKFAAAGEAAIKSVSRKESGENFIRIFITVEKSLDPEGDGNPKFIEFGL